MGESGNNGLGVIIYNDRNGYHSQKGLQVAFAHHLNFGDGAYVNKLSFGLAGSLIQNQLDETSFGATYDPLVTGKVETEMYYNVDFGFSYHVKGFFFNATLKNALLTERSLYSHVEQDNLRNYVGSIGYYISGDGNFSIEPSALIQYKEFNEQLITDGNIKFYYNMSDSNQFYLGASYRKDWDDKIRFTIIKPFLQLWDLKSVNLLLPILTPMI